MRVVSRAFWRVLGAAAAAVLLLGSCATTNRLDRYSLEEQALLASLRVPPAPTMDVDSSVWIDSKNPIGTALKVGTTILKASEAEKARGIMLEALSSVDVPASPQMFGAGGLVGDVVTAALLATLTVEQLEAGFRRLGLQSAQAVTDLLERDFYRARYR